MPNDVDVLLGQTDEGVVGDVAVREVAAPVAQPEPQPTAVQAPVPAESVEPTAPSPVPDPPKPGFVQSVTLGAIGEPDVPDDLTFVDPGEFKMPSFDALGEREDDLDIEEID